MNPDELRAIMDFLQKRVHLEGPRRTESHSVPQQVVIRFDPPTLDEMAQAGLNPEGSRRILGAAWWDEMTADVVETPDMCDPDDPPEQVLRYATDVVSEYIRKRAEL